MICCLYVGICFSVVSHHMPDHVVALAWHTRPDKIRSQTHELTCEAWHVYIRRGLRAQVGIFLGMGLGITFRVDTCMEHLNTFCMQF